MRLLHTSELKLYELFGANIPPYAILSHTWSDFEISFQELQSGEGRSKAGYHKIRRCCQLAASDGFQYAWVDTCCIDKTSSAELSEAINSMYHWYRNSEVCYVYLADVSSKSNGDAIESVMRNSRWFSRGWTLQELIAPPSVIFFDREWVELGTKKDLETLLSTITKIHVEVLRDATKLEEFSVAQKMSWASRRETKRVEDIAYCLLGIFGVHMPMLYGEGDHAFIRLQEEIMRNSADDSIFAWTSDSYSSDKPTPGLLALTPAYFTKSGDIVQSKGLAVTPFSLTNKGVHLCLPMMALSTRYLAILNCHKFGNETKNLGIYVERLSENDDVFKKVWCENLGMLDKLSVPQLEQENIFVKQKRVMPGFPIYSSYNVSVKTLLQNRIVLRDSVPFGWVLEDGVMKPPDSIYGTEFSVLRFWETDRIHGERHEFLVILRFDWNRASPMEEWVSVKVIDQMPDLSYNYRLWSYHSEERKLSLVCQCLNDYRYTNLDSVRQFSDSRVDWQHPSRKWWISVRIKRGMVQGERRRVVHIDWRPPKED